MMWIHITKPNAALLQEYRALVKDLENLLILITIYTCSNFVCYFLTLLAFSENKTSALEAETTVTSSIVSVIHTMLLDALQLFLNCNM